MPLFEVVILEKPLPKEAKEGKLERLALGPVCVIADSESSAGIAAVMDNPDFVIERSRMSVIIRPFA